MGEEQKETNKKSEQTFEIPEEMRKQLEEQVKARAAEAEFRQRLMTPITDEDARKELAEAGLREAQLNVARHSLLGRLSEVDNELAMIQMKRAEVAYRLNVPKADDKKDKE